MVTDAMAAAGMADGAFLPKTNGMTSATSRKRAVPINNLNESACLISRPVAASTQYTHPA